MLPLGSETTSATSFLIPILVLFTTTVQMSVFDQENFQGHCVEITEESTNVCDLGIDRVRSLRVDSGP